MSEIKKIKEYIDNNSDKFIFEIYGKGGIAENVHTVIDEKNDKLIVYGGEPVSENELFRVCESGFIMPSKKQIQNRIKKHLNGDFDNGICRYWVVRKLKNEEMFILDYLSIENYLKSIEIFNDIRPTMIRVLVSNITKDTNTDMGYGVWLHHVICDCTYENGITDKQAYRIFSYREYDDVISKGYYEYEVIEDNINR